MRGDDGKKHRIRRRLSTDRGEAELKLAELLKIRENQNWGTALNDLSLELFEARYMVYSKTKKKRHTHYYDKLAFQYMHDVIPVTRLAQVTPELLEQVQYLWKQQGKGPNQINRLIYAIKAAMRKAEEWKYVKSQQWSLVKPFKVTLARIKFLEINELSKSLKDLDGDYQTAAYLGSRAGLRLGEMTHLDISDIDFNLHRLHITSKENWQPKDFEKRFIPMPSDLEMHLRKRIARFKRVFERTWSEGSMSHMMSRKLKEIGLDATCHTLRHTFASHAVMAGIPIYTVSKWLGHSSVEITERHYAHLAASHMDEEIKKMPTMS